MNEGGQIAELEAQVAALGVALGDALALIERQQQRIGELEAQLAQDSHNSHLPPSRDLNRKQRNNRRRTKSLRKPSGKKPGGQEGHSGETLKLVAEPDALVVHQPSHCQGCGAALAAAEVAMTVTAERRQVFDLPVVRLQSSEHRIARCVCPACGQANQGAFPAGVTQPVQYGPQLRALCVNLHHTQMLPLKRLCDLLGEWLQAPVAPASVLAWVQQAAGQVAEQLERIRAGLRQAEVVHCDESGHYVAGQRQWLHVAATPTLTCYAIHPQRGQAGIEALGVLTDASGAAYSGTVVHDGFPTYARYTACRHALCNVHHLRELAHVTEEYKQPWAEALATLLLAAKAEVAQAHSAGATALTLERQQALRSAYRALLDEALHANPPPPGGWPRGKRGPVRKGKVRSLIERLLAQEEAVWRFAADVAVPFDNNLVERDIRMVKVQQKIAGCYRSEAGAHAAATLRSYLLTLRKQGHTVHQALQALFAGCPIPVALPE